MHSFPKSIKKHFTTYITAWKLCIGKLKAVENNALTMDTIMILANCVEGDYSPVISFSEFSKSIVIVPRSV